MCPHTVCGYFSVAFSILIPAVSLFFRIRAYSVYPSVFFFLITGLLQYSLPKKQCMASEQYIRKYTAHSEIHSHHAEADFSGLVDWA